MMMSLYVQDGTDLADARISPLHADDAALATLPPTLLQVSGAEFLLADFAAVRRAAGRRRRADRAQHLAGNAPRLARLC